VTTVVQTVTATFTKTYVVTLPAACPTKQWLATYDVVEVCTGDPARWAPPPCPSNFVVTKVHCDACDGGSKSSRMASSRAGVRPRGPLPPAS
jgi:hypothetical protein